jgi:MFS transporter, MFS domain-containing protein family, molybdate-anion transporter
MTFLLLITIVLCQFVPARTVLDGVEKSNDDSHTNGSVDSTKIETASTVPLERWFTQTQQQLRQELRRRGLSPSGTKRELQRRLHDDDLRTLRNGSPTTIAHTLTNVSSTSKANKSSDDMLLEFHSFRFSYISVYIVIMLADWMQGTHMYTLYLSYEVNISALFLTGFLSGAIFAPFLGSFVDKYGRKRSCIVYCILEVIINVMEHFDNFTVLLIGRVLGGISTNLLFSAFESWMTTEHRKRGYPESWLGSTYSHASIANGATAILAGLVAQALEDAFGHIGPFQGAIALTVLALILILNWEENYGEDGHAQQSTNRDSSSSSTLVNQFLDGWRATISDSRIWRIGLTQAFSEGAMYTFVFMWVPTLLKMDPVDGLPTGCVFSSLMMAITMGGLIFPVLHGAISWLTQTDSASELCAALVYFVAGLSMTIPAYCVGSSGADGLCFEYVIASFLVVEFCVGLFMPVAGTLRSKYVPDALQGAILNIFRLPLNAVVVAGTYATDIFPTAVVYRFVSGSFVLAAALQITMVPIGMSSHSFVDTSPNKKND